MLKQYRREIRKLTRRNETACVRDLVDSLEPDKALFGSVSRDAAQVIETVRTQHDAGLMESFLVEYGLNTDEGIALMCLAEAYLRVPDSETLDALIADKIGDSDWARHRGRAESALVNASTWALMLTGKVFRTIPARTEDLASVTQAMVQRLGEPVVRIAVAEAMKILGGQFVFGRTITEALEQAGKADAGQELYSFDMLGEAARTAEDAKRYFLAYSDAISEIAKHASEANPHHNSGISVKLSALHPRYETVKRERVMHELAPRVAALAQHAKAANIGLAIDAEEADRLDISLDVVEAVLSAPDMEDWSGFGVVVQAFSRRAPAVLDWLYALTHKAQRKISVRLVKGAYWDSEIKHAQVLGLEDYPVFTRKEATDVSYLACAQKLLGMTDTIYPQFATHNAYSAIAIQRMASPDVEFEFQRLHGMGEALHETLRATDQRRRRIYAPVGVHKDLLAYLVRRLLENGANSSFVNQIMNKAVSAEEIAEDPVARVTAEPYQPHSSIPLPGDIYGSARRNSRGLDFNDPADLAELEEDAERFRAMQWKCATGDRAARDIANPANRKDIVGRAVSSSAGDCRDAITRSLEAFDSWSSASAEERAVILEKAADLYERNTTELMALAVREAGKSWNDAIAEVREAVDFLRYYAGRARGLPPQQKATGVIVSISPWNFPLAIFTGQLSGPLAAGNAVVAKPAEQTPLIAEKAVALLHEAGVPENALTIVQGDGVTVGAALTSDARIAGVAFTGSTDTARAIDIDMAENGNPRAGLLAETGGLNAMVVDSTALLEQAVGDIVVSAFQSAGQRCSACRVLYVQKDIAADLCTMLEGAAAELKIGDPWQPDTDVGPVIDEAARQNIEEHCDKLEKQGRTLFRLPVPGECAAGTFVGPAAFRLESIAELEREIFGPVLHVIEYEASELDRVVSDINATGYGLTFGIHSRIDSRVDDVCAKIKAGNIYVNRNQIGAVVGVQPFGGEGLSGTGPKAGGPLYVQRFTRCEAAVVDSEILKAGRQLLEGPTGERNSYTAEPRGNVLCLGPAGLMLDRQKALVNSSGNKPVAGSAEDDLATAIETGGVDIALYDGDDFADVRRRIANLPGRRVQLLPSDVAPERLLAERSVSEDTTASGGNASLLAAVS